MTVGIFVFCGWRLSNQFDLVSETHLSCDTIGSELWLAILNSLLCPNGQEHHASCQQYGFDEIKQWFSAAD